MRKWMGILALLAALCLLPGGMFAYASYYYTEESSAAEGTFTDGILTYTYLDNTRVSVTDCETGTSAVNITREIDGYEVVEIGDEAFAQCESLQILTIPSSVTAIGEAAFYGCSSLESLTIPDGVTTIEDGTFFGCSALTELNLGEGIETIGDMAFGYCSALPAITLPETLTSIGDQLFYYCIALESVTIPDSLTALGSYTFYGCMSMQSFTIPAALEDVGAMTFLGCQSLETISVEDGNAAYAVDGNVLYNTDRTILYLYPAGRTDTSFQIPDEVLVVYAGAFFYASNLQQITFGAQVQYIGEMAFNFCSGLTALTIPETVTTISTTAFSDCTGLTSLTFEGADDEDGGTGEDLTIGSYAFFCCDNLKEVRLPRRVASIGDYAFGVTQVEDEESAGNDAVTVDTTDGDTLIIEPLEDFRLIGYSGAARDYVRGSDVDISFQALDFDWRSFFLIIGTAAAALILAFLAVLVIRRTMRKKKIPAADAPAEDDGYRSILDDAEEEEEEEAPTIPTYEQTLPHTLLHQYGHAAQGDAPNTEAFTEDKEGGEHGEK